MSKKALNELAAVLAATRASAAMRDLLEALLTPRERARLALRWRLVCLLASGVHQRSIARQLGISLCNITRGSRELKRRSMFRQKVSQFVRDQLKLKPGASPPRRPFGASGHFATDVASGVATQLNYGPNKESEILTGFTRLTGWEAKNKRTLFAS